MTKVKLCKKLATAVARFKRTEGSKEPEVLLKNFQFFETDFLKKGGFIYHKRVMNKS